MTGAGSLPTCPNVNYSAAPVLLQYNMYLDQGEGGRCLQEYARKGQSLKTALQVFCVQTLYALFMYMCTRCSFPVVLWPV